MHDFNSRPVPMEVLKAKNLAKQENKNCSKWPSVSEPHIVSRKVLFCCATLLRKLKHLEIGTGS